MAGGSKTPEKTAEEKALEIRQRSMLDDEIQETEARLKAIARGKLGRKSLLSGAPTTPAMAASRGKASMIPSATGAGLSGTSAGAGTTGASYSGSRTGSGGGVVR